ncbi:MAG TPA: hypothetical protein VJM34_14360 [Novosphingobium sp.]|nr:hypothetical protein [Novosphingobium sp.]
MKWGEIQELRNRVPVEFSPWGKLAVREPGYVRNLPGSDIERELNNLPPPDPDAPDADDPGESIEAEQRGLMFRTPHAPLNKTAARPVVNIVEGDDADPAPLVAPKTELPRTPAIFTAKPEASVDRAAVGKVGVRALETEQTIHNLAMNATAVGGFMPTGAMATRLAQLEQQRLEEKRKDEKFAYDRAREALEQQIRKLEADLAASKDREQKYRSELSAIEEIQRRRALGQDVGDDLLARAGLTQEDAKRDDFDDVLAGRASQRRDDIDREIKTQTQISTDLDRARDLAQRYDDGDPSARAEVNRLVQTTPGVQRVGGAAFQSERQETKRDLAEAVASVESAEVHSESAELTAASVSAPRGEMFDDDMDISLEGSTTISAADAIAPTTIEAAPLKPTFAAATGQAVEVASLNDELNLPPVPAAQATKFRMG